VPEHANGSPASPVEISDRLEQALFEIRRIIAGQDAMLERVLVCLLAQGHLLIEGVPGLAKTLTIKTTAGVLGGSFGRVQFTPDLVPSDLVYPHRTGETYAVTYNPAHRWFYLREMTREEALLLKCYDSKTDGRARFAPHTAFNDPTAPVDALPRESIELRALVFHA